MNRKIYTVILVVLLSAITACGSQPTERTRIEDRTDDQNANLNNRGPGSLLADDQYSRGQYKKAANLYRELADKATSKIEGDFLQQDFRLRAADAFARDQQNESARNELKKTTPSLFDEDQQLLYKIVKAQLAVNEARSRDAFNILPRDASKLSTDSQIRLGAVRADAWLGLRRFSDAILERIEIDPLITIPQERSLNHQWIWNQLQKMPSEDVFSPPKGMTKDDAGWWSLAAIVKKGGSQNNLGSQSELEIWKQTYPGHPATEDILFFIEGDPTAPNSTRMAELSGESYQGTTLEGTPRNIALLLPLSGNYAGAGQAILNGFRNAADNSFAGNVNYKVYDSADPSYSMEAVANHVVREGAEMIVGPLQKSVLLELLSIGDVGVPVLALNTLQDNAASYEGLFQFGLSPENEAAEVASRALRDGKYRTVVLASQDLLGERIANAFMRAYEQGGGRVVAYDTFEPKSNTISSVMKRLLRAESSNPLWEDIRKGTERVSDDQQHIDMIFFTASPRDSRLVRPIIQLHRAFDLPVYTSARVYNQPDPTMDRDLNGLVFCDMPNRLSGEALNKNRLASLGTDAYLLVNHLHELTLSPGKGILGETGTLSVRPDGQIWRNLECAVFQSGQPVLLP
ncbi:MAG: penicillin-binding protein activator [Gammaproteobacteria bacterium]